jgi:hypothetical protein
VELEGIASLLPPMVAGNACAGESLAPMRHPWLDVPLLLQVKFEGSTLLAV